MAEGTADTLTEPQRACLRLVLTHHNSKEIAALLGISPSAVDKRIERAVQMMGATSRFDAARRLAALEGGRAYDPLPCETIDVPPPLSAAHPTAQVEPWWLLRRIVGLVPSNGNAGTARNPLSRLQRALLILGLILTILVASLVLVNVALTLTRLIGPMRESGSGKATSPEPTARNKG